MANRYVDGEPINDPDESLIRRASKNRKRQPVNDVMLKKKRPHYSMFEPRQADPNKPHLRPDEYLFVNIVSLLQSAGLPLLQDVQSSMWAAKLLVGDCLQLGLPVHFLPLDGLPYHGGIMGVVELRDSDWEKYEAMLKALTKIAEIIEPEEDKSKEQ